MRRFLRRPKYRYMAVNRLIPHVPWLILMALSVILFKERIFADSAFYVAQFINNRFFWIECQRIVLTISQAIPLCAVWLGVDLRYVLILYSLSHVLFFYALFLFVYYGLRDRRSGLLLIITQTVGILYSFFTPMFELYYGVALLITFYSIWRLQIRAHLLTLILVVLEILILLSHPLSFMLLAFLLLYDYDRKRKGMWSLYLILILVMAGVIALKSQFMCPYETGKLSWQFDYMSNKQYLQFTSAGFYINLGKYFGKYMPEVVLALIIVIWMFARRRDWYRFLLVPGTFAAYLFLVGSVYTIEHTRYIEQVMFPFVPIVFIPLIYGFPKEPRPGLQNMSVLLISGLIAYRLFVIYDGSESFVFRTKQMENLVKSARQMGGSKFIISPANAGNGAIQFNWSYPLETLMLSAIDGDDQTITIVPEEDYFYEGNDKKTGPSQFVFRRWEIKDHSWLNDHYFHLDPGAYRMLADTNAGIQNLDELSRNLKIRLRARSYYHAMDTVWADVTIQNLGLEPLRVGRGDRFYLSYFWMKGNDYLDWNGLLTPVETDVYRSLNQSVRIAVPKAKGKLTLKVDIVSKDRMWFGINAADEVLVY